MRFVCEWPRWRDIARTGRSPVGQYQELPSDVLSGQHAVIIDLDGGTP